jgi:hypothetical protein
MEIEQPRFEPPSMPLVTPPPPQVTPTTETVQREPDPAVPPPDIPDISPIVQRAAAEEVEFEEEIDLTDLARRIYPIVKRLLAIERERWPGRLM